jgi:hypothetical protein
MRSRRTPFRASRLALLAVLASSLVACAGIPDALQGLDGSATAAQLNVPWQRQPMRPSAAIVAEADRVCRADIQFDPRLPLLLVDARGAGRLQLFYGADNGSSGECDAIFVAPDGSVRPGGSGGSASGEAWSPIAQDEVLIMSSGGSGGIDGADERHVAGRAGPGVARVQVTVAGLVEPIEASVDNGWWAAWWPGGGRCSSIAALAPDGSLVDSLPSC